MTAALVLGGAECVHEDEKAARKLFEPEVIVAVKDIGITYPVAHHWVTYHPERILREIAMRREAKLPDPLKIWSFEGARVPDVGIPVECLKIRGGSSGFLGMMVAVKLTGKAVLAGIPMDPNMVHYRRPKPRGWPDAMAYRREWTLQYKKYKHTTRSMSGWTRELFGAPTVEWINGTLPPEDTPVP